MKLRNIVWWLALLCDRYWTCAWNSVMEFRPSHYSTVRSFLSRRLCLPGWLVRVMNRKLVLSFSLVSMVNTDEKINTQFRQLKSKPSGLCQSGSMLLMSLIITLMWLIISLMLLILSVMLLIMSLIMSCVEKTQHLRLFIVQNIKNSYDGLLVILLKNSFAIRRTMWRNPKL